MRAIDSRHCFSPGWRSCSKDGWTVWSVGNKDEEWPAKTSKISDIMAGYHGWTESGRPVNRLRDIGNQLRLTALSNLVCNVMDSQQYWPTNDEQVIIQEHLGKTPPAPAHIYVDDDAFADGDDTDHYEFSSTVIRAELARAVSSPQQDEIPTSIEKSPDV